jgi:hypothetical protein
MAKKAAKKAAMVGASGLGCCTIEVEGFPDRDVPHVTKAQCTALGRAAGGVGQWNPGECAE